MANANRPFGLRPHSSLNGGPYSGNVRKFILLSTYAVATYVGDPVILGGTEGSLNADDIPVPTIEKGAANGAFCGVIVGFEPLPDALSTLYSPASTAQYAFVDVDPQTIFLVQGDSDTYAAADVGLNMTFTVSTGVTTTGISNGVADQSTAATTNTLDMQILGTAPFVDNDLTGGYPLLLVKLNNHQYVDGATGL